MHLLHNQEVVRPRCLVSLALCVCHALGEAHSVPVLCQSWCVRGHRSSFLRGVWAALSSRPSPLPPPGGAEIDRVPYGVYIYRAGVFPSARAFAVDLLRHEWSEFGGRQGCGAVPAF